MNRDDYRPTPPADVTAVRDGERWTLVFVRELHAPPEEVWRALTDPEELRAWAPFDPDRDLSTLGDATLTTAGADEQEPATVRRARRSGIGADRHAPILPRPPTTSTARGGQAILPVLSSTEHTRKDRQDCLSSTMAKVTAGWHICLDILDLALTGHRIGRIVGADAKAHWEPLNEEYSKRLR